MGNDLQIWDACDYFAVIGSEAAQCAELGISAETTDEELDALADAEREQSTAYDVDRLDSVDEHLAELRDWAREQTHD